MMNSSSASVQTIPGKSELKFVALSLDESGNALFKFPSVFDLEDPEGFYQQVCVPRQERALKRMIYS